MTDDILVEVHPLFEKIAKERLKMRVPEAKSMIVASPREVKP